MTTDPSTVDFSAGLAVQQPARMAHQAFRDSSRRGKLPLKTYSDGFRCATL